LTVRPWGMATAVGSLPFLDVEEAVDFVFARLPEIPHWPQLPQRSGLEGLIRQYSSPLLAFGLVEEREGSLRFVEDRDDWGERLTAYYEAAFRETPPAAGSLESAAAEEEWEQDRRFALPREVAPGFHAYVHRVKSRQRSEIKFLKGQVTGPLTMGLQITDSQGRPSFYSPELREVMLEALALQALWQVREMQKCGYPVIIFFDDPSLYSYGQSTTVGISGEAITASYAYLAARVKEAGALVGMHACAGVEWSLVMKTGLDIINADVYNYFPSLLLAAADLDDFLKRGGTLAWGLIPTGSAVEGETAAGLWEIFKDCCKKLAARGVDAALLQKQWLLTPTCGSGSVSPAQAGMSYALLEEMLKEPRP
jgi:hypothetical protein